MNYTILTISGGYSNKHLKMDKYLTNKNLPNY